MKRIKYNQLGSPLNSSAWRPDIPGLCIYCDAVEITIVDGKCTLCNHAPNLLVKLEDIDSWDLDYKCELADCECIVALRINRKDLNNFCANYSLSNVDQYTPEQLNGEFAIFYNRKRDVWRHAIDFSRKHKSLPDISIASLKKDYVINIDLDFAIYLLNLVDNESESMSEHMNIHFSWTSHVNQVFYHLYRSLYYGILSGSLAMWDRDNDITYISKSNLNRIINNIMYILILQKNYLDECFLDLDEFLIIA